MATPDSWINVSDSTHLDQILEDKSKTCIIFKHSTACGVSEIVLHRMKDLKNSSDYDVCYVDILKHRAVSDYIAEKFAVRHESPQVLLIKESECIYEESHLDIQVSELMDAIYHG